MYSTDRHLLAMQWETIKYLLIHASRLNIMADLLAWILQEQGVSFVIHCLDDILTIDPSCGGLD